MTPKSRAKPRAGEQRKEQPGAPGSSGLFGLEGFLGGLLGGMERLINIAEAAERAGGELRREGSFKGAKGLRGVYGFRIRTGLSGRPPAVETFGNLHQEKVGTVKVSNTREPLVDVFDEPKAVVIVAELPGVREQNLEVTLSGRTLSLRARDGERHYAKDLTLPCDVDASDRTLQYTNGILKLTYPKRNGGGKQTSGTT
jgi:HSP20 family protein